jgi:hypothetical protein
MRRFLLAVLLGLSLTSGIGCIIPIYSADPVRRTRQLIFTSEDQRNILNEWERIWFLDMPDHQSPFRTHGGVI